MATNTHRAALDRFLADNPELEQLSARLATFNVFRALKIERVEIRHSNTLAWLLDPSESHGLGDVALRRILSNILLASTTDFEGLTAAEVELMRFRDIEVRREWRHIDVLVVDRDNRLVVLIENKIGSGEGKGQLTRYWKTVGREFPSFTVLPVFLTLDGQAGMGSEAETYLSYSHAQLLHVIANIARQRRAQMPEAVAAFLDQYLDSLRRLTMQDEGLVDLCKTLYRRHREAIDLIVEYGMASVFSDAAEEALLEQGQFEILQKKPKSVWFIPKSWAKLVPENSTGWSHLTRPVSVACWIRQLDKKAIVIFEVGRMDDSQLRMKCVNALRDAGYSLTKLAFKEDAKHSRFHRVSQSVVDWSDEEKIRSAINRLMAKTVEEISKVEKVLKTVFA